jgi:hypothetical protein
MKNIYAKTMLIIGLVTKYDLKQFESFVYCQLVSVVVYDLFSLCVHIKGLYARVGTF